RASTGRSDVTRLSSHVLMPLLIICFFFQAEDGIRDATVTGVQTCALPICQLDVATNLNVKLTHALDTHLHNDYVSGCRELAADVGANVSALEVGADLEIGGITIRAIHTPGHTPDHKAYLLGEGGRHRALFSGGAVMLGAIARTDLYGPH